MTKTKILLVEDDKSLREIYGVRLYSEGYDIISAGDGEEALALAIKERPPLIISDVMMPKISGFDMLDILRSTSETKDIKVIMMTALSSEDQRARGESLGADRYLVKSQVGIEDVVRAVHEVLGDAPTAGAAAPAPSVFAAPVAPAPAPVAAPAPAAPASLPQPTAPFSTNRPQTLGDRVIHPLETSEPQQDFAAMMKAELNSTAVPAQAAPVPVAAPQQPVVQAPITPVVGMPQPSPAPVAPAPQPVQPVAPIYAPNPSVQAPAVLTQEQPSASGMSFEETPPTQPPVLPVAPTAPATMPTSSVPPTPPAPGVQ